MSDTLLNSNLRHTSFHYGSNLDDSKDEIFIAKAKQYGIPFGLYAYGMFVSVADAKVEAQNFLKRGDSAARFLGA